MKNSPSLSPSAPRLRVSSNTALSNAVRGALLALIGASTTACPEPCSPNQGIQTRIQAVNPCIAALQVDPDAQIVCVTGGDFVDPIRTVEARCDDDQGMREIFAGRPDGLPTTEVTRGPVDCGIVTDEEPFECTPLSEIEKEASTD